MGAAEKEKLAARKAALKESLGKKAEAFSRLSSAIPISIYAATAPSVREALLYFLFGSCSVKSPPCFTLGLHCAV